MRSAPISHRISLVHLLALALLISAGCMVGLFILMRKQHLLPPSRPQSGIVQLRLVQNAAPQSSASAAPPRPEATPRQSAEMPAAPAEKTVHSAEIAAAGRRASGGASATALPEPPSEIAFRAPSSETVADFQRRLLDHIALYRRFPAAARAAHLRGRVLLMFVMNRDGTVRDVTVEESSGAAVFDQEALDTVRRAQPMPPIPATLADHLKILLPVEYSAP